MPVFAQPARLLHTLRHLRVEQIVGQLLLRSRRRFSDPARHPSARSETSPCPRLERAGSIGRGAPNPQGAPNDAEALLRGGFTFIGRIEPVGFPPKDWQAPGTPKLWQYNLHYHEWLYDLPFRKARDAALHWIHHHPLVKDAVGWEAYPTSLRLQNWCALFFGRYRVETLADRELADALWQSIVQQATWLRDRLEWHLMGNHLLENAIALSMAGGTFGERSPRARTWLEEGLQLLEDQLCEQMLPDGMHFELSPMYHVRVTYGLLLLFALSHPRVNAIVRPFVERALRPLELLQHPDGDIPLFGDSAHGICPKPGVVLDWAGRMGLDRPKIESGPWVLPSAGYVGYRDSRGHNVFLADLGSLGPDHVPGHAHGDFGSWEASHSGERVVVDSGIGIYERSDLRDFVRSAAAHNTVEVEGVGQGDFWGAFRLGARGRAQGPPLVRTRASEGPAPGSAGASTVHVFEGVFRYPDGTLHKREFTVIGERLASIDDFLQSSRSRRFIWRMRVESGWSIEEGPGRVSWTLRREKNAHRVVACMQIPADPGFREEMPATRTYGMPRDLQLVRVSERGRKAAFRLELPPESHQTRPPLDGRAHSSPLKILFFSHYFPPEGNAPANRTHHHCKLWSEMGHEITVITCAPNSPDGVVYEGYENKWIQHESVDGIEVFRVWTFIAANKGFARRILNYLSYMFSALWRASRLKDKPNVIIATSPQFFCGWAGVLASWLMRRPLVLEVRDIWPESIVAVGAMRDSLSIRLLERLELAMYRASDRIVTVGAGYKSRLIAKGVAPSDVAVVMNGVDTDFFRPRVANRELAASLGIDGKFVVTYAGTLGMAAGLEVVIDAAKRLSSMGDDDVSFLLVGSGAARQELERNVEALGLANVRITGRVSREEVACLLSLSDAALIHLRKAALFASVLPSKIFEAAAMGLPIILGVEGEAKELLARMRAGIAITPGSADDLLRAIDRLRSDRRLREQFSEAGLAYARAWFERDLLARDMLDEVRKVR